jgi:3-oxoacyl-[acyl-carrier-protein] synthase-3
MRASIAGTGRYVPKYAYDNAFMGSFVGAPSAWTGAQISRKLGVNERRFAIPMNSNTGKSIDPVDGVGIDEIDMATKAANSALEDAGREAKDIDLLIYISCTAAKGIRRHLSRSAFDLHLAHARVHEMDAGCGGAVHAIEMAWEAILSGRRKTVLIVASSCPSQYMDRDLYQRTNSWLSPLIFGDGAGAVVLVQSNNGVGILNAVTSVDPTVPLMGLRGDPEKDPELAYWIDAKTVKIAFGIYAKRSLDELGVLCPESTNADMYIFHQVNANVLRDFVGSIGLSMDKVPINVDYRGNTAAAATIDILDQERRENRIGKGSLVVICAVGAGAQAGAIAVRL